MTPVMWVRGWAGVIDGRVEHGATGPMVLEYYLGGRQEWANGHRGSVCSRRIPQAWQRCCPSYARLGEERRVDQLRQPQTGCGIDEGFDGVPGGGDVEPGPVCLSSKAGAR